MRFNRKARDAGMSSMASMADIAFLLLTFFMISAVFVQTRRQRMDLPEAENIVQLKERHHVVHLWITPEGGITLDRRPVALAQLRQLMGAELSADPKKIVAIHVDGRAQFALLSSVLQELRRADARRIVFATERKKGL